MIPLHPCDVLHKLGYCTSTYTQGIPHMHQDIIVLNSLNFYSFKECQGIEFHWVIVLWLLTQTHKEEELIGQKDNHHTLIPRDSGNVTPQNVKPITFRGFRKKYFHNYNLLTLITLHKNQTHLPRDSQWYDDHNQQGFGGWEKKIIWRWPSLMNVITPLFKGAVLNDDISCLGPCWSLFWPNSFIPPYLLILDLYVFCIYTYPYVQPDEL